MNEESKPRSMAVWAVPAAVVLLVAGIGYRYWSRPTVKETSVATTASAEAATEAKDVLPAIAHPMDPAAAPGAVPLSLAQSDAPIAAALAGVVGAKPVADWLIPDTVIRRIVATVDNLSRARVAEKLRPLHSLQGPFAVRREAAGPPGEERITLNDDNFARYDVAVNMLAKIDMSSLAAVYRDNYALFQQAYEELGYPGHYFNDRLVETIDDLLAAPDLAPAAVLVQPKVMFEYADAALEARSAGQKLLMRLGPKHAITVKAQLAKLRQAITNNTKTITGETQ
jgi:Protein of unknown function (DUF3014)